MQKEFHPVANIFPMMSAEEFFALRDDIQKNGQLEPVWLHTDGRIIDGRNRYKACIELGVTPKYRTWNGDGSLTSFVVSLNLHRRHLSPMQKAAIATDIEPMIAEEKREKQVAAGAAGAAGAAFGHLGGRGNKKNPLVENFPQGGFPEKQAEPKARDEAAALLNVNARYVQDAKRYKEQAPEVFELARSGAVNGNEAKKLARMPEEKRRIVIDEMQSSGTTRLADAIKNVKEQLVKPLDLPDSNSSNSVMPSKFRVIYADPPWKYGNTMPDYFDEQGDHYPLMTVKEIAALPIVDMAEDDAVLFLWVTSPILEESFQVVNGWGFKYKSSFVWDKIKHNMGHYNSVRHELLLVCTRGSCQPDVQKLFDSVQSIERQEHSRKPEEFRQIIDTIYPYGERIELFARKTVDGWHAWGNEAQ